jgi:hypothetical protein
VSILLGTFVWDHASAAAIAKREVFDAYAAVYPMSVLVVGTLLSLHAWFVTRLSQART